MLIYINTHIATPIIPVIKPAFPILLPNLLVVFAPKIIANIPVGRLKYQNKLVIIDIIPNGKLAIAIALLFLSFTSTFSSPIYFPSLIFNSDICVKSSNLLTFIISSDTVYKLSSIHIPLNNLLE